MQEDGFLSFKNPKIINIFSEGKQLYYTLSNLITSNNLDTKNLGWYIQI